MQAAARLKVKPVKGKDKTFEQVVKGCEAGRSKAVRRVQSCVEGMRDNVTSLRIRRLWESEGMLGERESRCLELSFKIPLQ